MALSGKLVADFSSFYDAVQKAQAELRSFNAGADVVQKSLNRMTDSFSGRRVIQDATLMAQAIEQLGGVSVLTEAELQRLGVTANEAVAKMRAIGADVPQNLLAIAEASKPAATGLEALGDKSKDLSESLKGIAEDPVRGLGQIAGAAVAAMGPIGLLAGAMGTIVGAGGVLAEKAIDVGETLNNMAEKTGIAVPAMSALKYAVDVTGGSLDQVGNAMFMFERRMAESPESLAKVEQGLHRLGLSLSDIEHMTPDQQFLAIADAIKHIEDPTQRAAAGTELFGRQFRELAPLMMKDLSGLADQARRLGKIWTEDQAKAAEDVAIAFRQLQKEITGVGLSIGKDLIPEVKDAITEIALLVKGIMEIKRLASPGGYLGGPLFQPNAINDYVRQLALAHEQVKALQGAPKPTGFGLSFLLDSSTPQVVEYAKVSGDASRAANRLWESLSAGEDPTKNLTLGGKYLTAVYKELDDAFKANKASVEQATKAHVAFVGPIENNLKSTDTWGLGIGQLNRTLDTFTARINEDQSEIAAWADLLESDAIPQSVRLEDATGKIITKFQTLPNVVPRGTQTIADGLQKVEKQAYKASEAFGDVASTIQQIAQIAGTNFLGGLATNIGVVASAAQNLSKALENTDGSALQSAQALLVFYGALYQVGKAIDAASQQQQDILRLQQTETQLVTDFGTRFSDATEQRINAQRKELFMSNTFREALFKVAEAATYSADAFDEMTRKAAQALTLDTIIEDLGDTSLTSAEKVDKYRESFDLLFTLLRAGGPWAAQAGKELDKLFAPDVQRVQDAAAAVAGVLTPAIRGLIDQLLQSGRLTDDMADKLRGLAGAAPDLDKLESIAGKYGTTLSKLGGTLAQSGLDNAFAKLYSDEQLLAAAGGDTNNIIQAMAGNISKLVQQAIAGGLTLPKQFQGWIEQLAAAGQLLDENGNKITDVSNLKFDNKDLQTSLDDLTDAMNNLVKILGGDVPGAAEKGAKEMADAFRNVKMPTVVIPTKWGDPGPPPGTPGATSGPAPSGTSALSPSALAASTAGRSGGTAILMVEGRTLAEVSVPYIPGVVQRYQLAGR